MPRKPRIDFPETTHHVFSRGNGRQPIFLDDGDRRFFLRRLHELKTEMKFTVFAFCLMTNHFHLAIKRADAPLHKIMHRLLTAYARVFNNKWDKVGHTFQGRYSNRALTGDSDLAGLVRYIHLNPVQAGLCANADDWIWSSHNCVFSGAAGLVDGAFVRDLFGGAHGYRDFLHQPQAKEDRPALKTIAGDAAELLQGPSKTKEAANLRRDFIEDALQCGYRQSEIAAYLGRTRAAITLLRRPNN